jgi:hypothetical protein
MLGDLWRQFLTLPVWEQAVGTAAALAAAAGAVSAGWAILSRVSRPAQYVLEEPARVATEMSAPAVAESRAESARAQDPVDAATIETGPTSDSDSGREVATNEDAEPVEPANPDWADKRPLCPCCGYPTAMDEFNDVCVLCDWSEEEEEDDSLLAGFRFREADPALRPPPLPVQAGRGAEEREAELTVAKQNFARYGSSLSPEEREKELGPLSEHRAALRRQLRDRFEYLKTDPPDISETWDTIDGLITSLREENQ